MRIGILILLSLLPESSYAESLDAVDAAFRDQAFQAAWQAPIGRPVAWRNPVTGNAGSIQAKRETRAKDGIGPCRELIETLTIDGRVNHGVTTGCRSQDMNWHVVQSAPLGASASPEGQVPVELPPYQPPADISADPQHPAGPPVGIMVRPDGKGPLILVPPGGTDATR
jgi:surface antigen